MIRKIQTFIEANRLLAPEKSVIAGFSGGGDSVSLLYILNRLGYHCIAAHCNFHLREAESDRDEAFCRKFTEDYRITFEKNDFDTGEYAKQRHVSSEMAARELRYRWFEALRKKHGAQAITVAHHRDDSIETMLLNMIRGTGIRGLSGIRPKNGFIIRPLLCVSREEIKQFLKEQKLPSVTDSSNMSDKYTRNFIRLRLLPLMEEINPSVRNALSRTAENLADAENIYLQTIEKSSALIIGDADKEYACIPVENLMQQPAPKTILYELLKIYGFSRSVSGEIFRTLTGGDAQGKIFEATNESIYKLLKDRGKLIIFKPDTKIWKEYKLNESLTNWHNLPLALSADKVPVDSSFEIDKSPSTGIFDYDRLHFPLTLRKWKSGDWFVPFGMKGRQKLSDYFSNHKFNLLEKEKTWVLCSGNDIFWIIGHRTDNRFRINDKTKTAFVINFFGKNCAN
ncbi:MAG: tRNA lysidine(34) synthetase TilS [Tannerella sp.]|nr:tRNA lysidine(34) synthetase TilS [Tannerella sp.]